MGPALIQQFTQRQICAVKTDRQGSVTGFLKAVHVHAANMYGAYVTMS